MDRRPLRLMTWAALVAVFATAEQILFGRDTPGTAHDVSVAAWFLSLGAAAVFVVALLAWLVLLVRRHA